MLCATPLPFISNQHQHTWVQDLFSDLEFHAFKFTASPLQITGSIRYTLFACYNPPYKVLSPEIP